MVEIVHLFPVSSFFSEPGSHLQKPVLDFKTHQQGCRSKHLPKTASIRDVGSILIGFESSDYLLNSVGEWEMKIWSGEQGRLESML